MLTCASIVGRIVMAGTVDRLKAALGELGVHDALGCAGLATIGALAVATAANPFTWGAVAGGVATNVAGNLAANVWQRLDRVGTAKLLGRWRGIDENHVVVQALRKSHLEALRTITKSFRESVKTAPQSAALLAFADRVDDFTKVEWTEAERLAFRRPDGSASGEQIIRAAVLNALPSNFSAALAERCSADPSNDLSHALVEGALAEIALRTMAPSEEMPWQFVSLFRGTERSPSWFDLFIRVAAERLKTESAFEAIWNAEQQAYCQDLIREVAKRVERIEKMVGAPIRLGEASIAKFKRAIAARPTELLVARYRVVPYLDRGGVLGNALAWARATDGIDARGRLYVAPGGFGKTRFAIELVLALTDQGWACTFLSERNTRNLPPGALEQTVAGGDVAGRLVVLDYAESQIALLRQVADAAASSDSGVPIRIVALARSPEGWWQGTQAEPGLRDSFEPKPHDLTDNVLTEEERAALYESAIPAFRQALITAGLAAAEEVIDAAPLGARFDRPLTIAMAALLEARDVTVGPGSSVFEQVFVEERRHWKRLLGVQADNDPKVVSLHRAAAQVTLVQGAVPAGVHALMDEDPRVAMVDPLAREVIFAKLQTIYGVSAGGEAFVRPVEPDLLGEHVAMTALHDDRHGLLGATLSTALNGAPLSDGDVAAILTVLVRATRPEHDAGTRATAAGSLKQLAAAMATRDADAIRQVETALPQFSLPLMDLSLAVARRVVETSNTEEEEARAFNNLAARLSDAGQRQEALGPARRAVQIYEALARDNPAAYLPALASSLNNLANRLSETGQRQEALGPARHAVEIREALARDNPAGYLSVLAGSLNNLAIRLSEMGQWQEAVEPARRAVELYEALARDNPATYVPTLAGSLNNLAIDLSAIGQLQETLEPARRAVELYEALARDNPTTYLPDVAMSLNTLANRLGKTGRLQEALGPARRAVEIREVLARDNPAAYLPDLAMSCGAYGDALLANERCDAAIDAYGRSLEIFFACVESAPDRFMPYVRKLADRLSGALQAAGRADEIEPMLRKSLGDETFQAYRDASCSAPDGG